MNRKDRRAARSKDAPGRGSAGAAAVRALLEQGMAQHRSGNLTAAAATYGRILARDRDNAAALNLLGLTHYQRGDARTALAHIERAVASAPGDPACRNSLAMVLCELGRDADAVGQFREAMALDPGYAEPCVNLGRFFRTLGRGDEAVAAFEEALRRAPDSAEAHVALALALDDAGRADAAETHFRRAASLDPAMAHDRYETGRRALDANDLAAAIDALRAATALDPRPGDARRRLGAALRRANRPGDAVAAVCAALRLDPRDAAAWLLLAAAHKDLREIEAALAAAREALRLDPGSADAHDQLGAILLRRGSFAEAIEAFDRAMALDPGHRFASANRAFVHLGEGRFAAGWRDYRGRASILRVRDRLFQDRLPDDLSGKRVLLMRDQGLGDEIFFLRFAGALKARGATVAYRGDGRLRTMLERAGAIDAFVDETTPGDLPARDWLVSVGDLPWVSGFDRREDIPPPLPIPVDATRAAEAARALADFGPPPYIGVTWRAGVQEFNTLSKQAPPEALADALKDAPGSVVAVQRDPAPGELDRFADRLGRPVRDMTALNGDLEGMLGLLGALDDYVCVSNTNTHLRASAGRASRVLVPFPPEYRWMNRGSESPWFPGARLYRETCEDGWTPALAALAADLAHG